MSEERFDQIENRLDRVEALLVSAGQVIQNTAQLGQQNAEQLTRLERTMADLALRSINDRTEFQEWRRTTQAALDKIDRVLDYLMQRDGGNQAE